MTDTPLVSSKQRLVCACTDKTTDLHKEEEEKEMEKPSSEKSCPATEAGDQSSGGGSSSGVGRFKGVRMRKWGKWVAEVRLPNSRERIWLGSYDTPEKAARAYDAAVYCLRGPGAQFNFPHDPPAISVAGRLTPSQIQVAAARFAHGEDRDPVLTSMPAASTMHEVSHVAGMEDHQGSLDFTETFMPGPCGGPDMGILGSSFEAYPGDGECYDPTAAEDDEEANVEGGAFFESPNLWSF